MKKEKSVLSEKEIEERNKEKNIKRYVKKEIFIYYYKLFLFSLLLSVFPYFVFFLIFIFKKDIPILLDYYFTYIGICCAWSAFVAFCIGRPNIDIQKIRRKAIDKLYPDPLVRVTEEFFGKRFEKLH